MRLIDSCITQLEAQGPSRTCNESKEEEEEHSKTLQVAAFLNAPGLEQYRIPTKCPDPATSAGMSAMATLACYTNIPYQLFRTQSKSYRPVKVTFSRPFSQELCPSDGRSHHIAADGRRPCVGAQRCQAFSINYYKLMSGVHWRRCGWRTGGRRHKKLSPPLGPP